MRHACSPHTGQHTLGEREPIETRSWFDCSVTCSICSPSHKGRNNDTSILIHLVLQRVFLCRTMENVDSIQRKQAGILNVGKSLSIGTTLIMKRWLFPTGCATSLNSSGSWLESILPDSPACRRQSSF